MDARKLAQYVVTYFDSKGDLITNKKLQKLLYYIDAWGLVYFNDPIIEQEFEAWVHGPVVRDVYNIYKTFGYSPIINTYSSGETADMVLHELVQADAELHRKLDLVNDVLEKYSPLSSAQLELLTHNEAPWVEARNGVSPFEASSNTIDKHLMKQYYQTLLES